AASRSLPTPTPEIYPPSLHDALPISLPLAPPRARGGTTLALLGRRSRDGKRRAPVLLDQLCNPGRLPGDKSLKRHLARGDHVQRLLPNRGQARIGHRGGEIGRAHV